MKAVCEKWLKHKGLLRTQRNRTNRSKVDPGGIAVNRISMTTGNANVRDWAAAGSVSAAAPPDGLSECGNSVTDKQAACNSHRT